MGQRVCVNIALLHDDCIAQVGSLQSLFFRKGSHENKAEGSMADEESTKKTWVLLFIEVVKLPPPPPTIS